MNTKMKMRTLSLLLCFVMLVGLLPTTALAANNFVDFLTTDNNVEFAETGETGFMRVNLFGNGKVSKIPVVYRTDSLDYAFDGWYTAKEGGEKVTEDTVFNGYTILYDRWTTANIDSGKIISSITIPNSALVNGYTENAYINASSAVNMPGVVNSNVYAIYNGLNAYGSQVTGAETIDTSNDYSVVTTVKLEDGYYFDPNISLTAQHGVRAGVTYRAIVDGVGVTTNTWNNLATTVDICINFPAGGNNVVTAAPSSATESETFAQINAEVEKEASSAEIKFYGDFKYIVINVNIYICGYVGSDEKVEIPSEIDGMPVVGITDNAFAKTSAQEITVPSSVSEFGKNAFGEEDGETRTIVAEEGSPAEAYALSTGMNLKKFSAKDSSKNSSDMKLIVIAVSAVVAVIGAAAVVTLIVIKKRK